MSGTDNAGRATAWSGILGAVLFTAGIFMVSNAPGGGSTNKVKDFTDFYNDSGKRATVLIGAYVLVFACLVLIVFFTALHSRIRVHGESLTAASGYKAGLFGLTAIGISGALLGAPAAVQTFGDNKFVGVLTAHAFAEAGFATMLIPGMLGVALAVFTLSLAGRRTGSIQGWLGIMGMVVAVLLLAALFFLPMVLFPIWLLAAGIASLRGTPTPAAPA
jgi:hypothetical protein